MENKWYAVVTFGSPAIKYTKVHRRLESACWAANWVMGSGTCTAARVVCCATRAAAGDADVGDSNCDIVYVA
jgi:hypothetical protein